MTIYLERDTTATDERPAVVLKACNVEGSVQPDQGQREENTDLVCKSEKDGENQGVTWGEVVGHPAETGTDIKLDALVEIVAEDCVVLRPILPPTSAGRETAGHALSRRPQAMVDTPLTNFTDWIDAIGGITEPAGRLSEKREYLLVGGGLANTFLSLHLARAGAAVTVYDAADHAGGRTEQAVMSDGTKAPMGLMRCSPSEALWVMVMERLGYYLKSGFPDPGIVPTIIAYGDERTVWSSRLEDPVGFETVSRGFKTFLEEGLKIAGDNDLCPWMDINSWLANNQGELAIPAIQSWIDAFSGVPIGHAIRTIFSSASRWDIPGSKVWSEDDFRRFGTLGIGSGGFCVLDGFDFICMMRWITNGYETDQGSVAYYSDKGLGNADPMDIAVDLMDLAQTYGVKFVGNTTVTGIEKHENHKVMCTLETSSGCTQQEADVVIFGTTLEVMAKNITGMSDIIDGDVYKAIWHHSSIVATKCFVLVDVSDIPEVNNTDFPLQLLSDQESPQVYVLGAKDPNKRLVLILYGWEEVARRFENKDAEQIISTATETIRSVTSGNPYHGAWMKMMENIEDQAVKKWGQDPCTLAGFPMPTPGQNTLMKTLTFHWQRNQGKQGGYVQINGDFFGGNGGWVEGCFMSALTILSAEIDAHGELYGPEHAPCRLLDHQTFTY